MGEAKGLGSLRCSRSYAKEQVKVPNSFAVVSSIENVGHRNLGILDIGVATSSEEPNTLDHILVAFVMALNKGLAKFEEDVAISQCRDHTSFKVAKEDSTVVAVRGREASSKALVDSLTFLEH